MEDKIRIAGIIPESYTDGKGIRYVIFMQGCNHKCPGCQNPETWDFKGGYLKDIKDILEEIGDNPLLDGVTISGGDPLCNIDDTKKIVNAIRTKYNNLSIWVYTGFTYEECLNDKNKNDIIESIDVLVDGPFINEMRCLDKPFKGSSNQRMIDIKETIKTGKVVEVQI